MLLTGIVGFALIAAIALFTNRRFRDMDRLPMQWGLSGEVNWTAPLPVALAFIPAIHAVLVAALLLSSVHDPARYGAYNVAFLTVVLIAVQIFHLWMIDTRR